MFVAERFIQSLIRKYGEHPISTDGVAIPKTIEFRKATALQPLKSPVRRVLKPRPEKKQVNHFPPLKNNAKSSHNQKNVSDQEIASHFPPLDEKSQAED